MRASTRIIVNTLATYGQSLIAIVLSLFSARWVLMALGETDFGLYGVVGSIILLITFLNAGMSTGVARFYAYSIGRGHNLPEEEAVDDLKHWFNIAFSIHLVTPILLITLGYFAGAHAIMNWLTIPPDRLEACLWVFRISLVTGFFSIFSMPFVAMYRAHQLISELAIFNILVSVGTFVGAYILLRVDSDRLIAYASYMMGINAGVLLLQVIRAFFKFKACRVRPSYMYDQKRLKELFGYVGWKTFGLSCVAMRLQGSPILVNLFFGPQVNAAYSVANRVSVQATMLSTAMMGAFQPAITALEGRGQREKMLDIALQASKFGTLLVLFFVIPLILEMDVVLKLWLKNPPEYAGPLCRWMLAMLVVDRMTSGQMQAVNAHGQIAVYELVQGLTLFFAVPLMWMFFKLGLGPVALGYSLFITMVIYCTGRLVFCKWLVGFSISGWVRKVAVPVILLIAGETFIGVLVVHLYPSGFMRICMTTAACGAVSFVIGWYCLLDSFEKKYFLEVINKAGPQGKILCRRIFRREKK